MSLLKKYFPGLSKYQIYIKSVLYFGVLLYTGLNYIHYHNLLNVMEYMYQTTPGYFMSVYEYNKIFYPLVQYLVMFIGTLVLMMSENQEK